MVSNTTEACTLTWACLRWPTKLPVFIRGMLFFCVTILFFSFHVLRLWTERKYLFKLKMHTHHNGLDYIDYKIQTKSKHTLFFVRCFSFVRVCVYVSLIPFSFLTFNYIHRFPFAFIMCVPRLTWANSSNVVCYAPLWNHWI